MINDTIYNVHINFDQYANTIVPDNDVSFYLKLAQTCIAKYADAIYPHLSKEMLTSEDAISEVAYCIMLGEMKWKEDGGMKLSSWRIEQAKLGMQKYVNRKNRKHNLGAYNSLDPVLTCSGEPPTYLQDFENKEYATVTVSKIIQGSGLNQKEEKAARLRSEGYTFREIGNQLHCSDENARQLYNKAITKMGEYAKQGKISGLENQFSRT